MDGDEENAEEEGRGGEEIGRVAEVGEGRGGGLGEGRRFGVEGGVGGEGGGWW